MISDSEDELKLATEKNLYLKKKEGITILELSNFIFDQSKGQQFNYFRLNERREKSILISLATSALTSWPAGIWLCADYCRSIREKCIYECRHYIKPSNYTCWNLCAPNTTTDWVNPSNCAIGISLMFIPPIITTLGAYFGPKIMQKITDWVDKKNDLLRLSIYQKFGFRDENTMVTEAELRPFATMLMKAKSPLLKKLSFHQALIFAEEDLLNFHECVEYFGKNSLSVLSEKLRLFAEMDIGELKNSLDHDRILEIFNGDEKIWETLVCIIPSRNMTKAIGKKLVNILAQMKNENYDDIDKEKFITQIRNKKSIDKVTIESNEPSITLVSNEGSNFCLPLDRVIETSEFFANANIDCSAPIDPNKPFNLDISDVWLEVLKKTVYKEELDLLHDIKNIFAAASYFGIKSLLSQFDRLLANSGRSYKTQLSLIMNNQKPSFKEQWAFFEGHGMRLSQKKIAQELLTSFATTMNENIVLINEYTEENGEGLLDKDTVKGKLLEEFLDKKAFKKQLKDQDILRFAWENFQNIDVLKKIIVEFCAENQTYYAAAWVFPDRELDTAVKNFKSPDA